MSQNFKTVAWGIITSFICQLKKEELAYCIEKNINLFQITAYAKQLQHAAEVLKNNNLYNLMWRTYKNDVLNITTSELLPLIKSKNEELYALLSSKKGVLWFTQQINGLKAFFKKV